LPSAQSSQDSFLIQFSTKEYLVKWKSYPDSENNWIPEQDFQNKQCLED